MTKQISVGANGVFTVTNIDGKTGKVSDTVAIQANKALENKAIGQIVSATVKAAGTRRDAWLSLLGLVLKSSRLDGFKGQGDRATGKVSKEFKAAVRDAEGDTIRALVADGSIKLPKGEPEAVMQAFLSELREDKNYSNVKVTANRYFALVGANVVTASGYLMPVEVMQAEIAAVVDKAPEDNSVASKLRAITEHMGKETIDASDAIDSLSLVRTMLATLEGIVNHYAEVATNGRVQPSEAQTPASVVSAAAAAIDAAQNVGLALSIPSVKPGKRAKPGFSARLNEKREGVAA